MILPKNDLEKTQNCHHQTKKSRGLDTQREHHEKKMVYFRRFWSKELCHSEKLNAKKRYTSIVPRVNSGVGAGCSWRLCVLRAHTGLLNGAPLLLPLLASETQQYGWTVFEAFCVCAVHTGRYRLLRKGALFILSDNAQRECQTPNITKNTHHDTNRKKARYICSKPYVRRT